MDLQLTGKTALVTGGTRGLGLAIARGLQAEGVRVAITGRTSIDKMKSNSSAILNDFEYYPCEFAASDQVEGLVSRVLPDLGSLDILVNNAATWPQDWVHEMSIENWTRALEINLTAPFVLCRDFAQLCIKQRCEGVVLNVVSQAAFGGANSGHAHYAAAKAALVNLTRSMTRELAGKGLRVNAIAPGMMETDMAAEALREHRDEYLARIPLGRIANPEEIADVAVFLCSTRAQYIAGAAIDVSGGMLMH